MSDFGKPLEPGSHSYLVKPSGTVTGVYVIAEKTQARVVAENAMTLLGAGQFASASKNLESAFRDWMNASMAYQEHMRTHEGRSRAH
jgi:hypothetical protein